MEWGRGDGEGRDHTEVSVALSVGTGEGMKTQVGGEALVDRIRIKSVCELVLRYWCLSMSPGWLAKTVGTLFKDTVFALSSTTKKRQCLFANIEKQKVKKKTEKDSVFGLKKRQCLCLCQLGLLVPTSGEYK